MDKFKQLLKTVIEAANRDHFCDSCELEIEPEVDMVSIRWAAYDFIRKRKKERGWIK